MRVERGMARDPRSPVAFSLDTGGEEEEGGVERDAQRALPRDEAERRQVALLEQQLLGDEEPRHQRLRQGAAVEARA